MEDSDLQFTRKRPRLDSGDRSHEQMPGSTHSSPSRGEDQVNPAADSSPMGPSPPKTPDRPSSAQRPASRVTINMKSPAVPDDPNNNPAPNDLSVGNDSGSPAPDTSVTEAGETPEAANTTNGAIQDPPAASAASSPAQSVDIEVAEVEDMDQDPSTSNWRSLEDALRARDSDGAITQVEEQVSLLDSFPRFRRNFEVRDSIEDMRKMFEKSHTHDTTSFLALTGWVEQCVERLHLLNYDTFLDDREVWEELPNVVESLMKREVDFQPDMGEGPFKCLESFLFSFAQLGFHFIKLDMETMRRAIDAQSGPPHMMSKTYWCFLGWMFKFHLIPFYRALEKAHGAEAINMVSRLNDRVTQRPVNALPLLSEFMNLVLEAIPIWPAFATYFTSTLHLVHSFTESATERRRPFADTDMIESPTLGTTVRLAYGILRPADMIYQSMISKKPSWITSDTTETLIRTVGGSYQTMALYDHQLGLDIAEHLGIDLPDSASPEERAQIIMLGWKFKLLKEQLTTGRMELRVHGIENMQTDLVNVWTQNIRGNPAGVNNVVPQYLVNFIKDNKLLEYIVGVDSHPQLICRSENIVGFLVVTSTYKDEDTDVIWRSVTESHDPRFVAEILAMIIKTAGIMGSPEPILYLCEKLLELPLDRFDPRMIEYFDQLLRMFREKQSDRFRVEPHEFPHGNIVPLRLCLRLMRESRTTEGLSLEQQTQLQHIAGKQLSQLIMMRISDADKVELFEQCTQDISEANESAVGSIHALLALTSPYDGKDITQLALDFDLTRLIITELTKRIESAPPELSGTDLQHAMIPRIQLLLRVVERVPDTITLESSEMLWEGLFMPTKVDFAARSLAWDMFSKSLAKCAKKNSFFERFMDDFLPRVPPSEFAPQILGFAEQAVSYELRFERPPEYNEGEVISIPGMERIWHFILTAPPGTVEMRAITFAIEVYLDDRLIRSAPRSAAEATHVALVDRCVEQLGAAASKLKSSCEGTTSGEDEPMVIIPSDSEIHVEELRFSRSLLFLRQLFQGLRTRPQYTPPQSGPPQLALKPEEIKGELIEIPYQAFNDSSQTQIRKLPIGDLSTASELAEKLTNLTGFSEFQAFSGGQRLDFTGNSSETLRNLKLARSGLLIVRKQPNSIQRTPTSGRRQSLTLVDSEVVKHFDDLYGLLSLEDRFAKEIFDFLLVFPPQQRVRDFVQSLETGSPEMFPLDKPYKLLYSINCLSICLREESLEATPNQDLIKHSIKNLVDFLIQPEMELSSEAGALKLSFAFNSVDCLLIALTALQIPDDCQQFFSDPSKLTERLLSMVSLGKEVSNEFMTEVTQQRMISNSFAVLVEGSIHDTRVWDILKEDTHMERLISGLLLNESRQNVRKQVAEVVFKLCGQSPAPKGVTKAPEPKTGNAPGKLSNATAVDITATMWKVFQLLFPQTLDFPVWSQEFFEVALVLFETVAALSPDDIVLQNYLKTWGDILLQHRTREFVGREPVDHIVLGFTRLMKMCLDLAPSESVLDDTCDLVDRLFTSYLFPELSESDETEPLQPNVPVMHTETRHELYNVLLKLSNEKTNCGRLLEHLEEVIPQDYTYETNWIFDRSKTIRSPVGYAGLRNLSNTCYLNSLFTQLFMNVEFRKFILDAHITDSDSSQSLLAETKRLFTYMQDSYQKCVDPSSTVDTIRTYENEPIDINIQMDVDEFYNLLFDRWESQIVSDEDKKTFRSFYGGQLVQQIKSKECEHISERLEPFSAIQCDIKGKSDLEDSLRAYVEGETMQGDNKYSCTSCGRHVDAVKRACLKDIPDHLIFHLKRFDFDMISMVRSKINDEFHFPERIDMAPFKVEYLSDPSKPIEPDIFELVGVLVHSGTAESGHYYSYIKERPSAGSASTWVEFNDSDVTCFDPSKIADQCFGGTSDSMHGVGMGGVRFNKVWNAYMLFYQRVTHMEQIRSVYKPSSDGLPINIPAPLHIDNWIGMENEVFVRTYCLLAPYHAYFVRGLLEQSSRFVTADDPDSTKIQRSAIFVGLDNLDQIISRSKELPELENLLVDISRTIGGNPDAALWVLQWTSKRPVGIRNLILRSPNAIVRDGFSQLLVSSFATLKKRLRGDTLSPEDEARHREDYNSMLDGVVSTLQSLWTTMHLHSRAWDSYFDLVFGIAKLGVHEVEFLLDRGFLLRCLEMIWLDRDDQKKLKRYYQGYYRLVEKGRKFSHFKLMEALHAFLLYVDFNLSPVPEGRARVQNGDKYSLTIPEGELALSIGKNGELLLMKKILEQQANPVAAQKIVGLFASSEDTAGLPGGIYKVLEEGLRIDPASLSTPFLDATLMFCQISSDADRITAIIDYAAKGVETINESGGREHLSFFQNLVTTRNDRIGQDEFWFWTLVVERIPDWSPTLLHYPDKVVRTSTLEFLQQLLFSKGLEDLSDNFRQFYRRVGRELAQACVERLDRTYLVSNTAQVHVDQRVVASIMNVITFSMQNYFDSDVEEDLEFTEHASNVLAAVEQLTVDVGDELASGSDFPSEAWEDNSIIGSDSDMGLATSP